MEEKVLGETELFITLKDLVKYAGAVSDFNEIHYDPEVAQKAGLEKPIAHGMLSASLCVKELSKFVNPEKIKRIQAKFSKPVLVKSKVKIVVKKEGENENLEKFKVELLVGQDKAVQCDVLVEK